MARAPFCVYCGGRTEGPVLCDTCMLGVEKYPDQNAVILRAYFAAGHCQLETFLKHHAEFARWLTEHPSKEGA